MQAPLPRSLRIPSLIGPAASRKRFLVSPVIPCVLCGESVSRLPATPSPLQQQIPLPRIARDRRRPLEFRASLLRPPKLLQQISAHARQQMIFLHRRIARQRIHQLQPRRRTHRHPHRHRAIQLHHRRRRHFPQFAIQRRDARPIRFLARSSPRMTRRNRRLNRIRTSHPTKLLRPFQRRQSPVDEQSIPLRAILIQEQNRLSRRTHSRLRPRRLNLHQRHQSMHLRLFRNKSHQNSPQPQRLFTQCRTQPVIPRSCGISFIEDEIDDLQNRRQPRREFRPAGNFEWERALR